MTRHKILSLVLTAVLVFPSFGFSQGQAVKAQETVPSTTTSNTSINNSNSNSNSSSINVSTNSSSSTSNSGSTSISSNSSSSTSNTGSTSINSSSSNNTNVNTININSNTFNINNRGISTDNSTGMQIDNTVPFKDANGKVIGRTLTNSTTSKKTPRNFLGASLYEKGIDVYSGTEITDWNAVKSAGVTAIYIKLTDGITYTNPKALEQYNGAKSVGIKVGAYHFGEHDDPDSEYNHFAAEASKYHWDLKPVFDYEPSGSVDCNYISRFMNRDQNLIFYSSHNVADKTGLPTNKIWIAEPIDIPGSNYVYDGTTKGYAGIQYLWHGNISGLNGDADVDLFSNDVLQLPSLLTVDTPTQNASVPNSVTISGWALNALGTKQICILLDGQEVKTASLGQLRNDVYAVYPSYNNHNSGYSCTLNIDDVDYGNHIITVKAVNNDGSSNSQNINVVRNDSSISSSALGVSYRGHVQNFGWQPYVRDGAQAGTNGESLRLEALNMNLVNAPVGAHIRYQAHVQNVGWQNSVADGGEAGTTGQNLRIEAVKISLENMPGYTIQYRTQVQNIGWQSWVTDGQTAGTTGQGLRLEAIEIRIIKTNDSSAPKANYQAHIQNIGWQNWVYDGEKSGTTGQSLRLEALKLKLQNAPTGAHIKYQAHVQNVGWQNWITDGGEAGTDGKNLRLEALKISLENMPGYTVQYRAHVQNIGWQNWVSDGQEAGTTGQSLRIEAVQIRIVKKSN